jgi:hypothetical protein
MSLDRAGEVTKPGFHGLEEIKAELAEMLYEFKRTGTD